MSTIESWAITYRPSTLADVKGQEAAVSSIQGFLKSGRIPKCLLITGQIGSGKTTLSLIIAAAINGYKGEDLEKNPNLEYIDIGSNRSIEDVRALVQRSKFMAPDKYKVMLLDEVHHLTRASATPLLVTLESKASNVVWILCTNEPEKLLEALKSRCRIIKLNTLRVEDQVQVLEAICKREELSLGSKHDAILTRIAQACLGKPRDSVQLLQNVADIVSNGTKPSIAVQQALSQLDSYNTDLVVIKTLLALYTYKPKIVLQALADCTDHAGFINISTEMNRYLLDLYSETTRTYHSDSRRKLARLLKENLNGKLPPIDRILQVQAALVDAKTTASLYMIKEEYLLQACLPSLALK